VCRRSRNSQDTVDVSSHVREADQFADSSCVDIGHSRQIQNDSPLATREKRRNCIVQLRLDRSSKSVTHCQNKTVGTFVERGGH